MAEVERYISIVGGHKYNRLLESVGEAKLVNDVRVPYCRGLLSDLPRKSVEPVALASGTAVRTLQEFLVAANWEHVAARDRLQRRVADAVAELPPDPLGVIGVIDETSAAKKGDKTPGVRRQYLGCVGKIDSGIVTVHIGVTTGRFQALLDAELYLPQSWAADRERCREAGIPDDVRYRAKCGSARPFHRPSAPPPEKLPCAPLLTPSLWGLLVRNRRTGVFA